MPRFTEETAECHVLTFKEGVLSKLAHDLLLKVTRFSVDVELENSHVGASFDASSLRVVTAMLKGEPNPTALTDKQKNEIEENICKQVLLPDRFPEIHFVGSRLEPTEEGFSIQGRLHLFGTIGELSATTFVDAGRQRTEVEINQSDYGIKPFRAIMGAFKVKSMVKVVLSIPFGTEETA
ncbi:MAG: YceI family protein [Deltaproteobacteria bacterium]|nr:YceI family protein [Deltaproteobacteria bacterium]